MEVRSFLACFHLCASFALTVSSQAEAEPRSCTSPHPTMSRLEELCFRAHRMNLEEDFYPYGDGGEVRAALRRKGEELVLAAQLGNALLTENRQLTEEKNKLHEQYTDKIEVRIRIWTRRGARGSAVSSCGFSSVQFRSFRGKQCGGVSFTSFFGCVFGFFTCWAERLGTSAPGVKVLHPTEVTNACRTQQHAA